MTKRKSKEFTPTLDTTIGELLQYAKDNQVNAHVSIFLPDKGKYWDHCFQFTLKEPVIQEKKMLQPDGY